MIDYDTTNVENDKQTKCIHRMDIISQHLDTMLKFNLIYSKTQVCIIGYMAFWSVYGLHREPLKKIGIFITSLWKMGLNKKCIMGRVLD